MDTLRITEIRPVTKQKFQVEINGQPAFVLYKGELSRYHIVQEEELSQEIYREITEEILTKRAKLRAMHLLEAGDKTREQVRQKLVQGGYPSCAVEAALAYVESFHYIDDKRYAAVYVENQSRKKGRARIRMELLQKGVKQEIIDTVFEEQEQSQDQEPRTVIRELIRKKTGGEGLAGDKEKQRLYGFLQRRGFSSSDILSAFREWENE